MSDSIKSADRRLKLLLLLQSSKQLSVNKIADYFSISRRTVFRDLRALADLEVPIVHDAVEGYSLMKGYKVPPLMFNERELASIVLGLSFMKSQIDESMREDAQQVLLKIKSVLSSHLLEFINSIEDQVITSPYGNSVSKNTAVGDWFALCSAISDKTRIQFTYTTEKGESTRTIDPYFIVLYSDHWNVIGFDHDRGGRRNFKLASIKEIKPLPERFEAVNLSLKDKFIYNFDDSQLKEYQIEVKNDAFDLFVRKLPGLITQTKTANNTYQSVTFLFDNLEFLSSFMVKYLDEVRIITDELKQATKDKLNSYIKSI